MMSKFVALLGQNTKLPIAWYLCTLPRHGNRSARCGDTKNPDAPDGAYGGKARLESMTKKARSDSARNAAKAPWKNNRSKSK
jgi:hypothetical protein